VPSIEFNRDFWGDAYPWPESGDEWSWTWGDAETQWYATLLPRVRPFLRGGTVVEIAPGFGRWTQYLVGHADRFIGVDLAQACVDSCKERFVAATHASFETTDGKSLTGVEDGTADFVFSFDSLVHAEADVLEGYVHELARVLKDDGVAFIHHSNLGSHVRRAERTARVGQLLAHKGLPARAGYRVAKRLELVDWEHARGRSMTAARMAQFASGAGLACFGQEIINWGGSKTIDCLSVVGRPGSRWARPNVVLTNPHFMAEAASANVISRVYTALGKKA
jgi:SAM-dependent methyltransferase